MSIFSVKKQAGSHCSLCSGYGIYAPEACRAAAPPVLHKGAGRALQRVSKTNTHELLVWSASAEPRGSELRAGHCPATFLCPKFCSSCQLLWPLSHGSLHTTGWNPWNDDAQTTLPPFAPLLLPKQEHPADSNRQRYIFIHSQKSHPRCTPISAVIIKEAFGSRTLLNWHKAVMNRSSGLELMGGQNLRSFQKSVGQWRGLTPAHRSVPTQPLAHSLPAGSCSQSEVKKQEKLDGWDIKTM